MRIRCVPATGGRTQKPADQNYNNYNIAIFYGAPNSINFLPSKLSKRTGHFGVQKCLKFSKMLSDWCSNKNGHHIKKATERASVTGQPPAEVLQTASTFQNF